MTTHAMKSAMNGKHHHQSSSATVALVPHHRGSDWIALIALFFKRKLHRRHPRERWEKDDGFILPTIARHDRRGPSSKPGRKALLSPTWPLHFSGSGTYPVDMFAGYQQANSIRPENQAKGTIYFPSPPVRRTFLCYSPTMPSLAARADARGGNISASRWSHLSPPNEGETRCSSGSTS